MFSHTERGGAQLAHRIRVEQFEEEARGHSDEHLRGYLDCHDDVGTIRRGVRSVARALLYAETPKIKAYRAVLKSREVRGFVIWV